jgi:hypothetical protein
MTDISKTISYAIENQFPQLYRSDGDELIAFVKAYYEFLENTDEYALKLNRTILSDIDIDETVDRFLKNFQKTYLDSFPFVAATDKRFLIKHIIDYYSSKGSKNSLELLMRLLFNEEVDVYYPGNDVLRPSDSQWYRPVYLEVDKSPRTRSFINKEIVGSRSGARAFVEGIVTKRVNGKLIDIVYLSSVRGNFLRRDIISDDGILKDAPTVIGSLTNIDITLGGRNTVVGDIFNVITPNGKDGLVRITETVDATGKVDFSLNDGGYGFTSILATGTSEFVANTTQTYVATAMLQVDNTNLEFIDFEEIVQRNEDITLLSATDFNANVSIGDTVIGIDSGAVEVARGIVISVANTDANGAVITSASANSLIKVQCINDTTFDDQKRIVTVGSAAFYPTEYIDEESVYDLDVSSVVGTFNVGDDVEQVIREDVANTIIAYAFGKVQSANSTNIVVEEAWGPFITGTAIQSVANNSITAAVDSVTVANTGARGLVTSVDGANVFIRSVYGTFDSTNKIRGYRTKLVDTISSVVTSGAVDIHINGDINSNGAIDTITTAYANGIVISQNTSFVGLYGNTSPFYFNEAGDFYIESVRENLASPPRDANNDIIEIQSIILDIKTGNSADFEVGVLENTETVALNTDLVGANNTANTPYVDILLTGEGSGYGFVDSFTINDGGTQYSNGSSITISAGGFAGGDPYIDATATIETDGSGTITTITVDNPGEGYYTTPTITLPATAGTVANVEIVMDYGYGFPKLPNGDVNTLLVDALTSENFIIGSIGSLTRINPGTNYNIDPFVRVRNNYIASYERGNFYVYLANTAGGAFVVGEELTQQVDLSTTAKGRVLSYEDTGSQTATLLVERNSFNISFASGVALTGDVTGASGDVIDVVKDPGSLVLGDNADITGTVIVANGIATSAEVIDSGYGYEPDQDLLLEKDGFDFVITATANVINQGVGSGYWRTTTSHLNSEKKIHDNRYYQEYSYDVISGISLSRYEGILKKILHVAGNEMFGSVTRTAVIDSNINIANSSIEIS